ncbi:MAG: hypothetical protein M1490_01455, partial [Candidatus Bathyarchaeota archaeon]|nr:hypothetical protein [Candidatus Bathyarchaeota archaeon]
RNSSQLTQGMQRLAPKVKDGWIYKPKKERAWIGFGLKNREQASMEQMEQIEQQNILSNFSENSENKKNKNSVPSVPSVPNESQLNIITEESGLRHIEVNPEVYKDRLCGSDCGKL